MCMEKYINIENARNQMLVSYKFYTLIQTTSFVKKENFYQYEAVLICYSNKIVQI